MSASLLLIASLWTALQVGPEAPKPSASPRIWHVGSYVSELGARWSAEGTLDTGAVLLSLIDGSTGAPLVAHRADYGKGPTLGVRWRGQLGELSVRGYVLGGELSTRGDRRLVTAQQMALHNPTDAPVSALLEVRASAGPTDPEQRPRPSLPFVAGQAWTLEEAVVARGEQAVLSWVGTPPQVAIQAAPGDPFATSATLIYSLTVPPGAEARLEFKAAGPPVDADAVQEAAWRGRFGKVTWGRLDDDRRWESDSHGQFGGIVSADDRLRPTLVAALHVLRSFGRAKGHIEVLSDRPFGHPATDAATEAQILGLMFEYGFHDIGEPYLDQLLAEAHERAGALPLERKLAYLHGLARAVRLAAETTRDGPLAELIVTLLDGGGPEGWSEPWADGAVAVDPWLDPEHVRLDLEAVLGRAGVEREGHLPALAWGDVGDEPMLALMQDAMRSLEADDDAGATERFSQLMARASNNGAGALTPGGVVDGHFAMGLASVARELLFDDHGDELVIFPGVGEGLITDALGLETAWMATRFGLVKAQIYYASRYLIGGWVYRREGAPATRELMKFPSSVRLKKVKPKPVGGTAEVIDEGSVAFEVLPPGALGVRFNIRADMGDDVSADDDDSDDSDDDSAADDSAADELGGRDAAGG